MNSVLNLTDEELALYNVAPIEKLIASDGDNISTWITYYKTFLLATDYIIVKMSEQRLLNESVDNSKYNKVLENRQLARQEINNLQKENNTNI